MRTSRNKGDLRARHHVQGKWVVHHGLFREVESSGTSRRGSDTTQWARRSKIPDDLQHRLNRIPFKGSAWLRNDRHVEANPRISIHRSTFFLFDSLPNAFARE